MPNSNPTAHEAASSEPARAESAGKFSGARDLLPAHDFVSFHREALPALLARNGHLVARDIAGVGAIAFVTGKGASFTYTPTAEGVEVAAGLGSACAVVELAPLDFSDFANEIHTASGLAMGGKLHFERGGLEDLQRWEPALRALYHGRPIWARDAVETLVDEAGAAIDFARTFSWQDSDEDMAKFLRATGYLHVRAVFDADRIAELSGEVDRVRESLTPEMGDAWWSTNTSGEQVVTRINYLDRWSSTLKAACFDDRVQRLGRLLGSEFRVCDDRLDGPMAFIKNSNVSQGLGDLNWHQDDGLGGHPVMCPLMQVGVQLDAANPDNGQLWVLAGSHRYSNHPMSWGEEGGQPVVRFVTEPGDVTVHFGDILHTTPPPTGQNAGRRVLYFKFAEPKTFAAIPAGAHYNDLLFNAGAGGRVATNADTWSEDDDQEGFQVARFKDRDEA